jgi:RES domain-containing protein
MLYRARVFQSELEFQDALVHPHLRLGPPPASLAQAGRLNPAGISVFYGAQEQATAIAEVRPPVGSRVIVACFRMPHLLRLLNLALDPARAVPQGSLFDPAYAARMKSAVQMRALGDLMAQPVLPSDERMDYIPTQAVADYLSGNLALGLDGMIYPSAQCKDGNNVVLFHKSARLEVPALRVKRTFRGFVDEQADAYVVREEAQPQDAVAQEDLEAFDEVDFVTHPDGTETWLVDERRPSIELDPNSLQVHHVKGVVIEQDERPVVVW